MKRGTSQYADLSVVIGSTLRCFSREKERNIGAARATDAQAAPADPVGPIGLSSAGIRGWLRACWMSAVVTQGSHTESASKVKKAQRGLFPRRQRNPWKSGAAKRFACCIFGMWPRGSSTADSGMPNEFAKFILRVLLHSFVR
jgi:hypothetical protein